MGSSISMYQTNIYVQKISLVASDQFGAKRKSSNPTKVVSYANPKGKGIISVILFSGALKTVSFSCPKDVTELIVKGLALKLIFCRQCDF
jgi:hypothetical protein